MPGIAELIKVFKQLYIASYSLNVPPLALWIGLFARMLISKDW